MNLYSIKMRGSKEHNHISGAESIVSEKDLQNAVSILIKRALTHSKGKSDSINIKIEEINKEEIKYIDPLYVTTLNTKNKKESYEFLYNTLLKLNINSKNAIYIIDLFKSIKNMRGAVLLDVNNLKRLEKDKLRGIRATYMDFEDSKVDMLDKQYEYTDNLNKNEKLLQNTHFIEALCLSSKVCNAPNIIGEMCCSDDKNYTTGYIASKKFGYIRVKHMKDIGEDRGGRIFLYDPTIDSKYTLEDTIKYLENTKVIVKDKVIFK